jgi:hypothetical protein
VEGKKRGGEGRVFPEVTKKNTMRRADRQDKNNMNRNI